MFKVGDILVNKRMTSIICKITKIENHWYYLEDLRYKNNNYDMFTLMELNEWKKPNKKELAEGVRLILIGGYIL